MPPLLTTTQTECPPPTAKSPAGLFTYLEALSTCVCFHSASFLWVQQNKCSSLEHDSSLRGWCGPRGPNGEEEMIHNDLPSFQRTHTHARTHARTHAHTLPEGTKGAVAFKGESNLDHLTFPRSPSSSHLYCPPSPPPPPSVPLTAKVTHTTSQLPRWSEISEPPNACPAPPPEGKTFQEMGQDEAKISWFWRSWCKVSSIEVFLRILKY